MDFSAASPVSRPPGAYLRGTLLAQRVGIDLGAADADLNYVTAATALDRLEGRAP